VQIARDTRTRKMGVSALAALVLLATTIPASRAADRVAGSIRVSGPAFVARDGADWVPVTGPRPLVAGDRLKTGRDGYLVADMGQSGLIGLFGDSEAVTTDRDSTTVVDVLKGKVAFHFEPNAPLVIRVQDSELTSGTQTADGYVEHDAGGTPVVVMEGGSLSVRTADGTVKTVAKGERLEFASAQDTAGVSDERRAAAAPSPTDAKPSRPKYAGLTARGWTAIAVVTAAVAGGAAALAAGGGGGGGGNGSPSE
jgi:hypothetical protein